MKVKSKAIHLPLFDSNQLRWLWLTMGLTIALLTVFGFRVMQGHAEVKAGQKAKDRIANQSFSTTDGRQFSLNSMQGKIVVMHFFGTWCGYSKRQVPAINKLLTGEKAEALQVVGMSVKDSRSNLQAVKQFISDQKPNYPVVSEVDDKYFTQFVESGNVSVPQTLIYGRDGRLMAHYVGFNQQVGAEIEQKISAELAK